MIRHIANEEFMNIVVTIRYILGQVVTFCVPLIIIGFITPSITKLGRNTSRMLGVAVVCAYASSVLAAFFAMSAGYILIPHLSIVSEVDGLKTLPEVIFKLDIPQIMPAMSALVFSVLIGLAAKLAVALKCTKKSEPPLRDDIVDFGIPLFANIHLCRSVLTEVFSVMAVSQILYGNIPSLGNMLLFCVLLGVFAIGVHGNEKYYYLEEGLPTNSESIDYIQTGDIMLFGSDCLVLFFDNFSNSYSYTRIGHIEDEEAFVDALGDGTVEVSFEAGE